MMTIVVEFDDLKKKFNSRKVNIFHSFFFKDYLLISKKIYSVTYLRLNLINSDEKDVTW